jgi:hypothetical protein
MNWGLNVEPDRRKRPRIHLFVRVISPRARIITENTCDALFLQQKFICDTIFSVTHLILGNCIKIKEPLINSG